MWKKCDVKNQDEETAVPGVNICDVKNENESNEMGCEEWRVKVMWRTIKTNEVTNERSVTGVRKWWENESNDMKRNESEWNDTRDMKMSQVNRMSWIEIEQKKMIYDLV